MLVVDRIFGVLVWCYRWCFCAEVKKGDMEDFFYFFWSRHRNTKRNMCVGNAGVFLWRGGTQKNKFLAESGTERERKRRKGRY